MTAPTPKGILLALRPLAGRMTARVPIALLALFAIWSGNARAQGVFSYNPPGDLVAGSGTGREDETNYVPGMRFPIESAPAYANSQVWGNGGMYGPGGSQCDEVNYSYPWWDNYCETRSWTMPLCPTGEGHQGQDIRPATCQDDMYWAVAAEDGTVTSIGTYSLYLEGQSGTLHRYLHMEPTSIPVSVSSQVTRGQRLGRVSNAFGGTPTTIHLHYDINQYIDGHGNVYVPPYMALVASYQELPDVDPEPCGPIPAHGGVIDEDNSCFLLHGPMNYWRHVTDAGYGGNLYWTYAWDQGLSNWAEWQIHLERGGEYLVEVFLEADYALSQQARYLVRHNGFTDEIRLDQSADSGWAELGSFVFAAGEDQFVSLNDNTGESSSLQRRLASDAVRLTPLSFSDEPVADQPEEMGPGDPVPDAGGDLDADDHPPELVEEVDVVEEDPLADDDQPPSDLDPTPDSGRFAVSTGNEGCGCAAAGGSQPALCIVLGWFALVWVVRRFRG
ncbi:MAG: peptidoglycan DD-metalloendopeptidase family protein [Bradymonadales bacterium]|nr:peptidoglycan DD-metalloendopeptidase family protein [Bradymonadales bacterium]